MLLGVAVLARASPTFAAARRGWERPAAVPAPRRTARYSASDLSAWRMNQTNTRSVRSWREAASKGASLGGEARRSTLLAACRALRMPSETLGPAPSVDLRRRVRSSYGPHIRDSPRGQDGGTCLTCERAGARPRPSPCRRARVSLRRANRTPRARLAAGPAPLRPRSLHHRLGVDAPAPTLACTAGPTPSLAAIRASWTPRRADG